MSGRRTTEDQIPLFGERVRYEGSYCALLGEARTPEMLTGWITKTFGNGDVLVMFDGVWRVGSAAGCHLIMRRKDLEVLHD